MAKLDLYAQTVDNLAKVNTEECKHLDLALNPNLLLATANPVKARLDVGLAAKVIREEFKPYIKKLLDTIRKLAPCERQGLWCEPKDKNKTCIQLGTSGGECNNCKLVLECTKEGA